MKLIMESWRQYLNESPDKTYYWQTRGPWKSESQIEFGVTHVPKARPRPQTRIEQIFEEVRKNQFPSRPSRLNCVYLCENLKGWEGKSFCSYPPRSDGETYEVKLRGNYNLFKTNSEYWTEAEVAYTRNKREDDVERWAKSYWGGGGMPTFTEILVSPPESAIIIRKYGKPEEEDTDIDNDGDTDIEDVLAVAQAAATQGTTEGGKDPNIQKIEDIVYNLPNVTKDNFELDIQHDPKYSPGEYQVFQSEYEMDELASIAGLRMSHEITSMFEDAGFEVGETWSAKEPVVLIDPKVPR